LVVDLPAARSTHVERSPIEETTMTQLVLFGPPQSTYVRTARMACVEKGVPHALEPLAVGGDDNAKHHPWRRVPAMQHGELRLFETSAIARYVDDIGSGPSLLPASPAARAVMEQWISAINCYIYDSVIRNYSLRYFLPRLRGEDVDLAAVKAGIPDMDRDVARLDAAYAGGAYLAGDAVSLADLFVAPIAQTIAMFPEGKAALGRARHLSRAFEQLAQRPSYARVHDGIFG
jgi:glutathione S-transferase